MHIESTHIMMLLQNSHLQMSARYLYLHQKDVFALVCSVGPLLKLLKISRTLDCEGNLDSAILDNVKNCLRTDLQQIQIKHFGS